MDKKVFIILQTKVNNNLQQADPKGGPLVSSVHPVDRRLLTANLVIKENNKSIWLSVTTSGAQSFPS
jgi:hypothetical protein